MEEFLNIFNHRMISFFYRGWEKYRFFIEYERAEKISFPLVSSICWDSARRACAIEAEFPMMLI